MGGVVRQACADWRGHVRAGEGMCGLARHFPEFVAFVVAFLERQEKAIIKFSFFAFLLNCCAHFGTLQ